MEANEQVCRFVAEWFDPQPQLVKKFLLTYYPHTSEVEMKDISTNRKFLKRTKTNFARYDFILGGHLFLLGRDMKLVDYADTQSRTLLDTANERMSILVTPPLYSRVGTIVAKLEEAGLDLVNIKSYFHDRRSQELEKVSSIVPSIIMTSGDEKVRGVLVTLQGREIVPVVDDIKESFREAFGDGIWFCPSTEESALEAAFSTSKNVTATYRNSTCCIIKPHVVKSRSTGAILEAISAEGFAITAIQLFHMERASAAQFYAVYDGVVTEFHSMVEELCTGPAVVLEICAETDTANGRSLCLGQPEMANVRTSQKSTVLIEDTVSSLRKAAGPWDVDMAKELCPSTIRAKFGKNRVENAIHCTDLPKDGVSEVAYFFEKLASM